MLHLLHLRCHSPLFILTYYWNRYYFFKKIIIKEKEIWRKNATKKNGSSRGEQWAYWSTALEIRNPVAPKPQTDLQAERPRRPRQTIISQYLNAACKTPIAYTRGAMSGTATFLAPLPLSALSFCIFPPPFLFLDKKRRSLPAYLEAMRYTDAGRAPERNDVLIRTPIAEREKGERVKYIKIYFISR